MQIHVSAVDAGKALYGNGITLSGLRAWDIKDDSQLGSAIYMLFGCLYLWLFVWRYPPL